MVAKVAGRLIPPPNFNPLRKHNNMGMIGCFHAVGDDDLEALVQEPKRICRFFGVEESTPPKPGFLARLLGAKAPVPRVDAWQPSGEAAEFDADKAWHGIHFLLTGTASGGTGPLAVIQVGGREIMEEIGYGCPRGFTGAEVALINAALQAVDAAALFDAADPAQFAEQDIYPRIWEKEAKEDCLGYVMDHFEGLREFVQATAKSGRGMIVSLQ